METVDTRKIKIYVLTIESRIKRSNTIKEWCADIKGSEDIIKT